MNFENFVEELRKTAQEQLGENFKCTYDLLEETNEKSRPILWIEDINSSKAATPSLYLDQMYDALCDGLTFDECVKILIRFYWMFRNDGYALKVYEVSALWESARTRLQPVLIPKKGNQKLLKDLVYTDFLDVAIIYEVWLRIPKVGETSTMKVSNSVLHDWKISKEELHRTAMENLKTCGYKLQTVESSLCAVQTGIKAESVTSMEKGKLYELTTDNQNRGAAMMLNTDLLYELSGGRNLFILPCCVHGAILLVDDGKVLIPKVEWVLYDAYSVAAQERVQLSKRLYYFDAERREIKMKYGLINGNK